MVYKILAVVFTIAIAIGMMVQHAMTNDQIRSIADVKAGDTKGGIVTLHGTVTMASGNRFLISDTTGKVELSTCPLWYKRIDLHEGDDITVSGQVMNSPSCLAKCDFMLSVFKIYRGGEIIEVRRRPGKPPWIGYRSFNDDSAR